MKDQRHGLDHGAPPTKWAERIEFWRRGFFIAIALLVALVGWVGNGIAEMMQTYPVVLDRIGRLEDSLSKSIDNHADALNRIDTTITGLLTEQSRAHPLLEQRIDALEDMDGTLNAILAELRREEPDR